MKQSFLKTAIAEKVQVVDSESGEIIEERVTHHKYIANSKEEFFIGYVSLLSLFKSISGPSIKVYAFLLESYKPGIPIAINTHLKKMVEGQLRLKSSTINNSLSELVKENLLYRPEGTRGIYYLNPRYAFKGSTTDRNNSLKAIIELGCIEC